MNLPEKLKNGDDFKRGVFEKINAIRGIDPMMLAIK